MFLKRTWLSDFRPCGLTNDVHCQCHAHMTGCVICYSSLRDGNLKEAVLFTVGASSLHSLCQDTCMHERTCSCVRSCVEPAAFVPAISVVKIHRSIDVAALISPQVYVLITTANLQPAGMLILTVDS